MSTFPPWRQPSIVLRWFAPSIVALLMMSSVLVGHGQQAKADILSDVDKADIVESALRLELTTQNSEFVFIRSLSLENIEFLEPARISKLGFYEVRHLNEDQFVQYVVFRQIYSIDGIVTVVLSRMVEGGRPCFGPYLPPTERRFTYEFKKSAGEWVGQLARQPPPRPIFFSKQLLRRDKSESFKIKNK